MARIRQIEINNFRAIEKFRWDPSPGINCLVGPGDSGKSTVLDAIDLCLGARRSLSFSDADFHRLDVTKPIEISVTVGELSDSLKTMDAYGLYLRGYDAMLAIIEEEPASDNETVLTVNLSVSNDLDPVWCLVSERAAAQGQSRNLAWSERVKIAPTRLGAYAEHNLSWRRGSVLNLLSEERADASAALVQAARDARAAFGEQAGEQLKDTLAIVEKSARDLGIPFGASLKAMLDSHSVSFAGGTISLHDEAGVPLRGLGVGSTRLLIAALQRAAAAESTIVLVDELEHGLEPHRLTRLLGSLGAKEEKPPLQAFMTTHSPAAIRELDAKQLSVLRRTDGQHRPHRVPTDSATQGTIRLYPDALLAPSVIVCEGASEIGLLRGLDQHRWTVGERSLAAMGVALVDGKGADQVFQRASVFQQLGYRTAVLRDDDVQPTPGLEMAFIAAGGKAMSWRAGRALEDELFASLSDPFIYKLLLLAVDLVGPEAVDANINSASNGTLRLGTCTSPYSPEVRAILGKAARSKKSGWFKSVTWMEQVGRDYVAPDLTTCDQHFSNALYELFAWMDDGGA